MSKQFNIRHGFTEKLPISWCVKVTHVKQPKATSLWDCEKECSHKINVKSNKIVEFVLNTCFLLFLLLRQFYLNNSNDKRCLWWAPRGSGSQSKKQKKSKDPIRARNTRCWIKTVTWPCARTHKFYRLTNAHTIGTNSIVSQWQSTLKVQQHERRQCCQ